MLFFARRASYDARPADDQRCVDPVKSSPMTTENFNIVRWHGGEGVLIRPGLPPQALNPDGLSLPAHSFLALPSDVVRSLSVPVAPDEVKHLRQALPFMLEESLLEDVTELHFAHAPLDNESHAVAVVGQGAMAQWAEDMPEELTELPWIPEALCLPWSEGQCTLLFEADHVLARWSRADGARVSTALLPALLDTLKSEVTACIAYGADETSARSVLPQAFQNILQWRQGGFSELLLLTDGDSAGPDLRQGEFAPRLPLLRWWATWQRVAIALGVALIFKTGLSVADYQVLRAEDVKLRQAIQESYRRVNPQGAVVDVEKQLNRQLAEYGAGSQSQLFTPSLVSLLGAASSVPGIKLSSVNYSGGREIRINIAAPDFQSVEQLREQLGKYSLPAELENSNARSEGVVARLRVELK